MTRLHTLSLLLAAIAVPAYGQAATPQATGLVYFDSLSIWLTAPSGWVLDPASGKQDGVVAVLYPKGESWQTADAVMYPNQVIAPAGADPVREVIATDSSRWASQVADLTVQPGADIAIPAGYRAVVRVFRSPAAQHFEAVGYIRSDRVVWLLVLAARTENGYRAAYPLFESLVRSFQPGPRVQTSTTRP